MDHCDIDLKKLQSVVDLIATLMKVPAGLIMKLDGDFIEVFISSNSSGNPYKVGHQEKFHNSGLYCETVIKTNSLLIVPNALKDEDWKDNPDVPLNMISYLGLPINLPTGEPFGTICVLDTKENHYSNEYIQLLKQFSNMIEDYFQIIDYRTKEIRNKTWKASLRTIMDIVNNTLNQLCFFKMRMTESNDFTEKDIELFNSVIRNCSNELFKMSAASEISISREHIGDIVKYT